MTWLQRSANRLAQTFRPPAKPAGRAVAVSAPIIEAEAVPFQEGLDELLAERQPSMLKGALYLSASLILSILVVASIFEIDIVVVGTGRLTTDTPPVVLQPLERGVIREILVKPGDVVTRGQVLARLDPTFSQADRSSLEAQHRAVIARLRRLEAEIANTPWVVSDPANPDEQLQHSLYLQRTAEFSSKTTALSAEIERFAAAVQTLQGERASLQQQLAVAQELEQLRADLVKTQTGSRLNLLEAQSNRLRVEQQYRETGNRLEELGHQSRAKHAELQLFQEQWRRQLLDELVVTRNEAVRLEEALTKAVRRNNLEEIVSPNDGVILDVAQRSVGSVLREAETFVRLVPTDVPLIADIVLNSSDVGYVRAGNPVVVKVDAFPYQRHGALDGRLHSVSQGSFSPTSPGSAMADGAPVEPGTGAVHRGRVEIENADLENMPDGARLIPGMTLRAEIKVGTRSVISYFLYPITRGLQESIREP